jgi:hypothetical protein
MTICILCGLKLVKIGNIRKNGKNHNDWKKRNLHKKCYKLLINNYDEDIDFARVSGIDNLLCSFNGCNDLKCLCRICEGCNEERIPKDIADMTGGICINCDVEKYTSEIK